MTTEPRIYVACLASYNNGVLHGVWIDCAGKDAEDIQGEVNAMLRESRFPNVTVEHEGRAVPSAEEWAIHDHEGFAGLIDEHSSFEDVAAIAEIMSDGDDDTRRGLVWLVKDRGFQLAEALERAEDVRTFEGTPADYAEDFASSCYSEKELGPLAAYIDYERFGHDLLLGGDIAEFEDADGTQLLITNASEF